MTLQQIYTKTKETLLKVLDNGANPEHVDPSKIFGDLLMEEVLEEYYTTGIEKHKLKVLGRKK